MNTIQPAGIPRGLTAVLILLFVLSLAFLSYGNYAAGSGAWEMIISTLLLSIPLGLLYFSIGLLAAAYLQKRSQGQISRRLAVFIYYAPRIAGVLITFFIGLFALDVFEEGQNFRVMLGGFIIHALPAIILAILLALAWRWEWIGAIAFIGAALYCLRFLMSDNWSMAFGNLLIFSGPLAMIGILFWLNWKWRKELHPPDKA